MNSSTELCIATRPKFVSRASLPTAGDCDVEQPGHVPLYKLSARPSMLACIRARAL